MATAEWLYRSPQSAPGLQSPRLDTLREVGQLNPGELSVEMPASWNDQVKRMLGQHPEARPYLELRQKWQALYQSNQKSKTAEEATGERELAARLEMAAAYEVLTLELKIALVM